MIITLALQMRLLIKRMHINGLKDREFEVGWQSVSSLEAPPSATQKATDRETIEVQRS